MTDVLSTTEPRSDLVRPLGFAEARMHIMQCLFRGNTQGAAVARVEGPVSVELVERALEDIRQAHEILGVDIVEHEGALFFRRRTKDTALPFSVVPAHKGHPWRGLVEQENRDPLNTAAGLWRLFMVTPALAGESHYLVLLSNHAIIDGTGCSTFFQQVLTRMEQLTSGSAPARQRRRLPPAAESIFAQKIDWAAFEAKQANLAASQASIQVMKHVQQAAMHQRTTRVVPRRLEPQYVSALLEICRAADVSLYSYVSAALLIAAKLQSPQRAGFTLHTALSLRPFCASGVKPDDLGCYLSVIATSHEVTAGVDGVARLAREHHAALLGAALKHGRNPAQIELAALRDSMKPLAAIDSFIHDLGITYLEVDADADATSELQLSELYITANRALGSLALVVHAVKCVGALCFTVNSTRPLQSEAWVDSVSKTFFTMLMAPGEQARADAR